MDHTGPGHGQAVLVRTYAHPEGAVIYLKGLAQFGSPDHHGLDVDGKSGIARMGNGIYQGVGEGRQEERRLI